MNPVTEPLMMGRVGPGLCLPWRRVAVVFAAATITACGGGGSGSGGAGTAVQPPVTTNCTAARRNQFVHDTARDWYLFLDTLPASISPSDYAGPQELLDAMTATARAQGRDRGFSYVTSIAEENAFNQQGSQAGFGIRVRYDATGFRLFVIDSFEGSPAGDAGLARGDEITAISSATDGTGFATVQSLFQSGGQSAVSDALGPTQVGVTRSLRILRAGVTSTVTMTKRTYNLQPIPLSGGYRVIDAGGGRRVGYVNLRTFIDTADPALRAAFQSLQAAGVSQLIVDLRYNGGGLVRIAELLGDLLGANRTSSEVFSRTSYNTRHADQNTVRRFASVPQSIGPTQFAFITTGSTASSSELVINALLPYGRDSVAIIGDNTFGKPVGQSAFDLTECDDRLRLVTFSVRNANNEGDYFDGLAGLVGSACRATDDITRAMGDPAEGSTQVALAWLATRACPNGTLAAGGAGVQAKPGLAPAVGLLEPDRPTPAQRAVPGLF